MTKEEFNQAQLINDQLAEFQEFLANNNLLEQASRKPSAVVFMFDPIEGEENNPSLVIQENPELVAEILQETVRYANDLTVKLKEQFEQL